MVVSKNRVRLSLSYTESTITRASKKLTSTVVGTVFYSMGSPMERNAENHVRKLSQASEELEQNRKEIF
jgi:hypothetical protein